VRAVPESVKSKMASEASEEQEQQPSGPRPEDERICAHCKRTDAAAWSGGPRGKKRKGELLDPSYAKPAWCCNLMPCQRACGFVKLPKAVELESVNDTDYLSEMISIRGTRCVPAPLPSLPSLHAPCLTLLHASTPTQASSRHVSVRFDRTQVLRALENDYAR
jgi:hypothetical protein